MTNDQFQVLNTKELEQEVLSPLKGSLSEDVGKPTLAKQRGKGRPPKTEVAALKKGAIGQGKRGRPVGTAGRIEEFKARLLATGGDRIIDKIVSIALDDEHPGQVAALKMCMDRLLPMSYFDKKDGSSRGNIQITISTANGDNTTINANDNVVDQEIEDVDYRDAD
jgi:hypothetical protein